MDHFDSRQSFCRQTFGQLKSFGEEQLEEFALFCVGALGSA